jgi:hypothetical protein
MTSRLATTASTLFANNAAKLFMSMGPFTTKDKTKWQVSYCIVHLLYMKLTLRNVLVEVLLLTFIDFSFIVYTSALLVYSI